MHSLRGRRLLCSMFFSAGALSGILCLRCFTQERCGQLCSLLLESAAGWPRAAWIAIFLAWPLTILVFGVSVFGGFFISLLLVICGYASGAAAFLWSLVTKGCGSLLLALLPFSCCIVSFAADTSAVSTDLRRAILAGEPIGAFGRYSLMRMAVSFTILLMEALCLMQLELMIC